MEIKFYDINEIRRDLRSLRRLTHRINILLDAETRHRARLACLEMHGGADTDCNRLKTVIAALNTRDCINRATDIEVRYMTALMALEEVDRIILIDGYINGRAYWQIGRELGYSEDGIRKRAKAAIEKLAESKDIL